MYRKPQDVSMSVRHVPVWVTGGIFVMTMMTAASVVAQAPRREPERGKRPDVGNGHVPPHGPPRSPPETRRPSPPPRGGREADRPGHPVAPHVHVTDNRWVGHERRPDLHLA